MRRMSVRMVLVVLVGLAFAGTADARGVAAFVGRAADPTQADCFTVNINTGWVSNTTGCGSTKFLIPLETDSNGSKTINVAGEIIESFAPITCVSVAVPRSGSGATVSPPKQVTTVGTVTNMQLTGSNVSTQGLLFVQCDVGQNGSLIQVDWNN